MAKKPAAPRLPDVREPADQAARVRIRSVLTRSMIVDAGAGSGKTPELASRRAGGGRTERGHRFIVPQQACACLRRVLLAAVGQFRNAEHAPDVVRTQLVEHHRLDRARHGRIVLEDVDGY